jgi:hypothetical protein
MNSLNFYYLNTDFESIGAKEPFVPNLLLLNPGKFPNIVFLRSSYLGSSFLISSFFNSNFFSSFTT